VAAVLKRDENGHRRYRILWSDGEYETLYRTGFLTRYTTMSLGYNRGS